MTTYSPYCPGIPPSPCRCGRSSALLAEPVPLVVPPASSVNEGLTPSRLPASVVSTPLTTPETGEWQDFERRAVERAASVEKSERGHRLVNGEGHRTALGRSVIGATGESRDDRVVAGAGGRVAGPIPLTVLPA